MTSEQDKIDQREDGGAGGRGDQRIIGTDIRARWFLWWRDFLNHFVDLGQGAGVICEVGHIWCGFFRANFVWNEPTAAELSMVRFLGADRVERAMSQQFPSWRTQKDQTLWLSMLIETMEKFSRPEWRGRPVDRRQRLALRARLAQPAVTYPTAYASRFSLRN